MRWLFLYSILLTACGSTAPLTGLWQIDRVTVGEEEMTPTGRWIRFGADGTEASGNGWIQHTVGTYRLSDQKDSLTLESRYGLADTEEPFLLLLEGAQMEWRRKEAGQVVTVALSRTETLPTAPANLLWGAWQSVTDDRYHFFRWDNTVVTGGGEPDRLFGLFKTGAHANTLEVVYYETPDVIRYSFAFTNDDEMTLTSATGEVEVYCRIRSLPVAR